jgi:thymidylate kinase
MSENINIDNLKQYIYDVYEHKAVIYWTLFEEFEALDCKYIIIDWHHPDAAPGDIDIIIDKDNYQYVSKILESAGFHYYTKHNTNQYLWQTYVERIGICQIHIYVDVWYQGNRLYDFKEVYAGTHWLTIEQEYTMFLIESIIYDKYNVDKYYEFKNHDISGTVKNSLLKKYVKLSESIYNESDAYAMYKYYVAFVTDVNSIFYLFSRVYSKIARITHNNDIRVVILGVDGAGKTSSISNVAEIMKKGGIYTRIKKMGVSSTFINRIVNSLRKLFSKSTTIGYNIKNISDNKVHSYMHNIAVILYWMEYTLRLISDLIFLKVKPTLILYDRYHYDYLLTKRDKVSETLFMEKLMPPHMVIYLNGDNDIISLRKEEYSSSEIKDMNERYTEIISQFGEDIKVLIIDTVENDQSVVVDIMMKSIFNLYKVNSSN